MATAMRVILSGVLIAALVFGLWLAIYAPTVPKLVITYTFMPLSQAVPLSLFGGATPLWLLETGESITTSGSGVYCYIPENTQAAYSTYDPANQMSGKVAGNFMAPKTTKQATMRCIAVPTFQDTEPVVNVNWQYVTPSGLMSSSPQSGTVQVQAGSFTDIPITVSNNAASGTAYFSAIAYQFSSANATIPLGGTYAPEGQGYTLQNICSAAGSGSTPAGTLGCGESEGGIFVAPLGPGYDAVTNPSNWVVTQGPSGTTQIITQSTSTSTVTTVVSGTVTTSTTTQVVGENVLTVDPLAHTQQVTLPIAGYLVAIFSGVGLFFVNRKQISALK